ncbi:hypothetical protein WL48_17525 [Burkholderia ubonensis]|nr:hypothetical protein WL49_29055 [Burkholderia ubonensis]KWC34840.1 hypothetical protein WL48_17525 [Burkholderia ubonensis]
MIKQFGQHFAVHDILVHHERRAQLAGVRVECEMDLEAGAALRVTMLANLPFAFAVDLHARAVDNQVQQFATMDDRQFHPQRLCTTAHGRVIRYRQIGESQIAQALRKALQGAQWQMEHRLQAEQCLNQYIAVHPWTATCGLGVRHVRKNIVVNPHGDVASIDQARIVCRPVSDTVLRLWLLRFASNCQEWCTRVASA